MTAEVAVVLLVAILATLGSTISLLVTFDPLVEEAREAWDRVDDPERDSLDWEWRLRMAAVPEAYWY